MTRSIPGAILALLALAAVQPAHADGTAHAVVRSCRELLKPSPEKTFDVGLCVGGFTTLHALSGVVDQHKTPILGFCRPANTQYLDMVRVFVRHVETHPQTAQL